MNSISNSGRFAMMRKRLNKLSDDQFIQPGICAEALQIPLIAEQNFRLCSRSSAKNASEWRKKDE